MADTLPQTQLPDGTWCHHEGESSTYCTRCWTNLRELRREQDESGAEGDRAEGGAADNGTEDVEGELEDDASLSAGERILRKALTQVAPRLWLWLSLLAGSHLLGFPVALAFIAAMLDALFFLSVVWQVDYYEEEPWRLVERTFFWGALPAIMLAVIGEVLFHGPARFLVGSVQARWIETGFVAPIVEELCKGAVLVTLFRRHRDEFDGMLDGLLYGALVGLGFSMTENVVYYLRVQPDHLHGMITARGLLFGMNHACSARASASDSGLPVTQRLGRAGVGRRSPGSLRRRVAHGPQSYCDRAACAVPICGPRVVGLCRVRVVSFGRLCPHTRSALDRGRARR